jgi:hypothetical protein
MKQKPASRSTLYGRDLLLVESSRPRAMNPPVYLDIDFLRRDQFAGPLV